ncbi:substrate-binding periplasmic protein [Rheinheimera baltica]|uniref:substrate-binding periplasmic protein n=1 Tax=Rheinheimera baltica TaxID=67576 RepID=UPI00273E74A2|nr:transporter substrate-binding domain-containing protein [Rheinheimera baltica]MDP5191008.1 transporter substrate-binding domain-containing protein [Rheinheimera baltica]
MLDFAKVVYAISCLFIPLQSVLAVSPTPKEETTNVVYLASLEWPPFTGQHLPDGGRTTALVSEIFRQLGYVVKIDYLPWSRAVKLSTGKTPKYLAYFPEYPLHDDDLRLSGCIGYSHVGLVEHKNAPLQISSSADLQNYTLGVVQDYVNTTTIDQMIKQQRLTVKTSLTDKQNLLRVGYQRLDGAVIDYDVMKYLLQTEPDLAEMAQSLQFNSAEYELKTLHMAVNINHPQARLLPVFNKFLSQHGLVSQYPTSLSIEQAGLCQPEASMTHMTTEP